MLFLTGNILVIGAVMSDKRLWKEGNIFIVNLAVADLCVTGMRILLQKIYRLYSKLSISLWFMKEDHNK